MVDLWSIEMNHILRQEKILDNMKTLDRSGLKIRIYNEIFINETLRDLVLFIQFKNMKNAHGGKLLLVKLH